MAVELLLGLPERRWLKLALALNFQPQRFIDDSWYATLPCGKLVQQLSAVPVSAAKANGYLREHLLTKLDTNVIVDDFSSCRARLALLDGEALVHLSLYVGLALRSQALRNELSGERLRDMRSSVGERAFEFAIKRAPFLGTIPDFPFEPKAREPSVRFTVIGASYCIQSVATVNEALSQRMVLRLPQAWAEWLGPYATQVVPETLPLAQNETELPFLLHKLIKEQLPQWIPLFV